MKVVLFCGGLGARMRENSDSLPKPMVTIGYRPVLWHVMNYYASHGYKDFILCLGYRADLIKQYFLTYSECMSNDFVLSDGGKRLSLLRSDIDEWRITFVDTGLHANIGQRLAAVRPYLEDEPVFLANYSDGLTGLPLTSMIEFCQTRDVIASFLCVKPRHSFHVVSAKKEGVVSSIRSAEQADIWINGGYFVFKNDIFDYIREGEELVEKPFGRLIKLQQLLAYKYEGFWAPLDTFKDRHYLEELYARGDAPWEVWKKRAELPTRGAMVLKAGAVTI